MADNKSKKASKKKSGITIQIVLCIAALAAIAFMTVRICRLGIIPLRMYATLAAVLPLLQLLWLELSDSTKRAMYVR